MITVVITVWKRSNLKEQMYALLNQTLQPAKIWIYHCCDHQDIDMSVLEMSPIVNYQFNTGDFGYFGRFSIAMLSATPYVYILDDDVIPSQTWLENCLSLCNETNAIIASSGRIIPAGNYRPEIILDDHYMQRHFIGDSDNTSMSNLCAKNTIVDYGCNSWFLKTDWLSYFWSIKPFTFSTGEDIHLSASCHFNNILTLVPYQDGVEISGNLKKKYGWDNFASWKGQGFHQMRSEVLQYWIKKLDWNPILWNQPV